MVNICPSLEYCAFSWSNFDDSTSSDFIHTIFLWGNCHGCFQIISMKGSKWKNSLGGLKKSPALDLDLSLLSQPRVLIIQGPRVSEHMITDLLGTYCLYITPLIKLCPRKSLDSESQEKSLLIPFTVSYACFCLGTAFLCTVMKTNLS